MTGGWQLGIDIGGTFTDVVAFEPATGTLRGAKAKSRPDDPLASLLDGPRAVGVDWDQVADLVHGTTAIPNAIVDAIGTRVFELPITPERVVAAIARVKS